MDKGVFLNVYKPVISPIEGSVAGIDVELDKYILSDVHSEMLNEGKNTNLFLWFDNDELRSQFMESELVNLEERIAKKFGNEVMVFPTFLNPKQKRF